MPPRKQAASNGNVLTENHQLVADIFVPTGSYVIAAEDSTKNVTGIWFVPGDVEDLPDDKIQYIEGGGTLAASLASVAKLVEKTPTKGTRTVKATVTPGKAPATRKTDDPDAPYGRLADGTPRQKPGRKPTAPPEPPVPAKKAPAAKKAPVASKAPAKAAAKSVPTKATAATKRTARSKTTVRS